MTEKFAPPHLWPREITYLRKLTFSKAVPSEVRRLLAPRGQLTDTSFSRTRIRVIADPSHPACGQCGLFATRKLEPGTHVVDYMGHVHLPVPEDSDPASDYDLSLRHGTTLHLGIDAARSGNESRMINDYRGVAKAPNAGFDSYVTQQGDEVRMGVFVLGSERKGGRGIRKGEEILISYGKGFWQHRDPLRSDVCTVE